MNQTSNSSDALEAEVMQPTALEAISRAEIDVAIATARRFSQHQPHQLSTVKQGMMSFATLDEETAASCFYTLPRGGKNIQGPSVRLAEIALACYGNLRAGSRIIATSTSGPNPHVVVQSVVMDLEKNISVSIEKRRRIVGKKSKGGTIDEDDINLAANACSAIAFRDAVFKVVPLALVKPVLDAARKVAIGDVRTLVDRRAKCIESFAKMGVDKTRILAKLEIKSVEDIDLTHLETLIGLFNAIKEGESIDDVFATSTTKPADLSDLNERLKAEAAAKVSPTQTPIATPVATPTQTITTPVAQHVAPNESPKRTPEAPAVVAKPEPVAAPELNPVPVELPVCKYCHASVEDMSTHNCRQMAEVQVTRNVMQKSEPETSAGAGSMEEAKLALDSLIHVLGINELTPDQCLAFCKKNKIANEKHTSLRDLSTLKLMKLAKSIETNPQVVAAMKSQ